MDDVVALWRWHGGGDGKNPRKKRYSMGFCRIYILYTLYIYIYIQEAGARKSRAVNLAPKRRRPLICFSRWRRPWVEGRGERQVSK